MPPHSHRLRNDLLRAGLDPGQAVHGRLLGRRLVQHAPRASAAAAIKQQNICPTCNEVVERTELVKGYEFAKDQYVQFTDEELKALEGEASKSIDIAEFVPLDQVDPIYFEKTYYLGPDKGGEKAYRLLADAMDKTGRCALAKYVMRGKENLVLIRPAQDGLMLHTMYFADEVRDFGEVDKGEAAKIKDGELELALQLIDEHRHRRVPARAVQRRVPRSACSSMIEQKVEGKEVTVAEPAGAARAGHRPDGRAEGEPAPSAGCPPRTPPPRSRRPRRAAATAKAKPAEAAEEASPGRPEVAGRLHYPMAILDLQSARVCGSPTCLSRRPAAPFDLSRSTTCPGGPRRWRRESS